MFYVFLALFLGRVFYCHQFIFIYLICVALLQLFILHLFYFYAIYYTFCFLSCFIAIVYNYFGAFLLLFVYLFSFLSLIAVVYLTFLHFWTQDLKRIFSYYLLYSILPSSFILIHSNKYILFISAVDK